MVDDASWKKLPCLGCEEIVKRQRDPWSAIAGTRSGSWMMAYPTGAARITATEEAWPSEPIYLFGTVHRGCIGLAWARVADGRIQFPERLSQVMVQPGELDDDGLQVHRPASQSDCLLCQTGGGPLTEEHLWSEWISNYLTTRGATFPQNRGHETASAGPRPPVLCDDCNNRWGSVLEADVKEIMVPMFEGPTQLSRQQQQRLATWATKTALVLDAMLPERTVPRGFGHDLRIHQQPPDGVSVWVARFMGSRYGLTAHSSALHLPYTNADFDPPAGANAFVATFTAYRIAFQVLIGHPDATLEIADQHPGIDAALVQIWPIRDDPAGWDREVAFSDESLEILVTRIIDGSEP